MGEVFAGRYELLDPVATGGMGTIWRVLDRADGQVKAAKILRQSDAASLLRFVREQSMRIDHTHVVTPLSWAGVDDRVLFTMPLVRGGSVADLLHEHGALPPALGRDADRPAAAGARGGARRRHRPPRRQARQPAARAHRHRPPAPAADRLRHRRARSTSPG